MRRTFNIGTECFALLTCSYDPEFLLPVKVIILEKFTFENRTTYKVKIRDIFETNFDYLKEHMCQLKLATTLKSDGKIFIKKSQMDEIQNKTELLTFLNEKPFYLEDNYITSDKDGLKDLYIRFMKYIMNFHFEKLYELMNRSFISSTPLFENQKNMFKKRVEKIGFGDIFEKVDFELDI